MANEKRLIVASELAERVWGIGIHFVGLRTGKTLVKEAMEKYRDTVLRTICEAPTVDAVEVVHGRWIQSEPGYRLCSHCMADVAIYSGHRNYCPNCGAKMDGGKENR